ncbi:bifunctional transcriptional activator/DNA repair enzyme AdaA [Rhizobium halophytocola]|uniref:AraC family transcriptional regulator of adaptative response/methylated-DNA-[protein]-cysteine methyltransferase n=1 Tax=Rhizobium halophytocola TaxID=735519 RepID=A0ABS4DYS0_9HYPH|nr:trifunctional transcriptional activator/DNA repair protein Ada/methylated-DNA--[protein]-cysteine S-methyltransferase [Rhizobium halophytocola]MBP1850840.1 AraC family transcriptional regulator of adaptative response/methylated-DNA-[protein]-cysteine methyltransferase [Rhizobium halophytocola]
MLTEHLTDDDYYHALVERDAALDGLAFVCVTSTGIFCRFTCPARKPKRENCRFHTTIAECMEAGFRPCKRCRPLLRPGEGDPVIAPLLEALEADPARRFRQSDIAAMGFDPSTVRRAFKRRFGMSFLEMARQRRMGAAVQRLAGGGPVIEAQIDAGFESGSGFRSAVTQLFGAPPRHWKDMPLLKASFLDTPIGPMVAICCDHALHLLEFADRPALPAEIRALRRDNKTGIVTGRTAVTDRIEAELTGYFAGKPAAFTVPLSRHGTPFERQVWQALRAIPPGETRAYLMLATALDRPTAFRAVARANGANRLAIVIPCHRVIGSDGGLTGYGGGLWRKRWLLEHERRMTAGIPASTAEACP